ncbi:2571_t:CDS:1, partial [Ambispora gerdemannii]
DGMICRIVLDHPWMGPSPMVDHVIEEPDGMVVLKLGSDRDHYAKGSFRTQSLRIN